MVQKSQTTHSRDRYVSLPHTKVEHLLVSKENPTENEI